MSTATAKDMLADTAKGFTDQKALLQQRRDTARADATALMAEAAQIDIKLAAIDAAVAMLGGK